MPRFVLVLALVAPLFAAEQGKFRLHKFAQPIGEETYTISPEHVAQVDFLFTDRGRSVPLHASLKSASDGTPKSFEIKGGISRFAQIDQAVEIQPKAVRIRDQAKWKDNAAPPKRYFTIAGYAPATLQMLLMRYWMKHGKPAELAVYPRGTLRIQFRGHDPVIVAGTQRTLDRYSIQGLIWGRETLWLDDKGNLAALVTVDAEFDHFEATREEFEPALGTLIARAGEDGMSALAEISQPLGGSLSGTFVLTGANLIDATGAPAQPNSTVVIQDSRIVAAGPNAQAPPGASVIDVHGKTVMPGLWDMHAHFEQVEWGPLYLASGITTVRDCGNEFEFIRAVRDTLAAGRGLGPRLLLVGVMDGSGEWSLGIQRADTTEQTLALVRRYHAAGFQQIKIYSSVKLEQIRIATAEAHRLGMTVTGHVPEGLNAYQAVEAGMDQINHIQYIAAIMHKPAEGEGPERRAELLKLEAEIDLASPEVKQAIGFLKAHGTVMDPTMALMEMLLASTAKPVSSFEPGIDWVAPELFTPLADVGPPSPTAAWQQKRFDKELEIVAALHRAGIPIVAGTDQSIPGYSLHRELELYVRAGLTPMEALQAATIVPARVMGQEKEAGTVEPGKRADLIILDGNPLEDIRNTRNVEQVIVNGRLLSAAPLWQSIGFKPWRSVVY